MRPAQERSSAYSDPRERVNVTNPFSVQGGNGGYVGQSSESHFHADAHQPTAPSYNYTMARPDNQYQTFKDNYLSNQQDESEEESSFQEQTDG
jgi:hypothetical protein